MRILQLNVGEHILGGVVQMKTRTIDLAFYKLSPEMLNSKRLYGIELTGFIQV